jgi:hypothetical protein
VKALQDGYDTSMSDETEHRDDPLNESEGAAEEDMSPQDAPAEPEHDRTKDEAAEPDAGEVDEDRADAPAAPSDDAPPTGSLPRTTTTGDDEQDYRQPGDGAVSAVPDDDLEESR